MARDDAMHQRLLEWAAWVTVGDGSGFPVVSVLHESWSPPTPGTTPSMKVSAPSSSRQTHRILATWSLRQRNTVVLYYCTQLPVAEQAARLECDESTVHKRIVVAHRLLRRALDERSAITPHPESRVDSGILGVSAP